MLSACWHHQRYELLDIEIGLALPGTYGDDDVEEIVGMAFRNVDPYDKAAAWG
ncbi:hypothetical protein ACIBQ6_37170 [Nonomuraea sp. NPDC049655]|uniref:hypothetical protein n=1 Tax=Nonomuraea sp. NPDC049655 TaxID=3364355 RepID=UPI0037943368